MTTTVLEKPASTSGIVRIPVKYSAKSEHKATISEGKPGIAKHTVVANKIKKTNSISPNINLGYTYITYEKHANIYLKPILSKVLR